MSNATTGKGKVEKSATDCYLQWKVITQDYILRKQYIYNFFGGLNKLLGKL